MSHQVRARLSNLKELGAALKELEWYTGGGGYQVAGVQVEGETAVWQLEARPAPETAAGGPAKPGGGARPTAKPEQRRTVEPGDTVIVETKGQQMARRFGGAEADGVEGTVFRVLTRGPHPHGMKVELRDRTVGRVKKNLTVPGAGEPTGER